MRIFEIVACGVYNFNQKELHCIIGKHKSEVNEINVLIEMFFMIHNELRLTWKITL